MPYSPTGHFWRAQSGLGGAHHASLARGSARREAAAAESGRPLRARRPQDPAALADRGRNGRRSSAEKWKARKWQAAERKEAGKRKG